MDRQVDHELKPKLLTDDSFDS